MKGKVLITDDLHHLLQKGLEEDGYLVDYRPDISPEEVSEIIESYTGLIINSKVYAGYELLNKAPNLKFIARAGSGLEVIDLPLAAKKNITVFNSPEGNRNAVAEHALGMLLSIMNNIPRAHQQLKNNEWVREQNRGNEIRGKTIGLLAYGNTAQAFAKITMGFDVNILAYDKYYHGFTNDFVIEASLETIFEKADVLSIHLPLTEETKYWIDYKFLSSFKRPIWLINTSRGKVLKTSDLLRCMEERKIIAAALDVFENENISSFSMAEKEIFEQLTHHSRILLTPHIAGWTHESKRKIAQVLLDKIRTL